jgi:aminopeptidase
VSDARLARLADVLVGYSAGVKPGELVLLELDLAEIVLTEGSDEQIEWLNPALREDIERVDVRIVVEGATNTKSMTGIDPRRQALVERSRSELRDRYLERALSDGDPVARWQEFSTRLQRVADFLAGKQQLRIVAEGTDLSFEVGGRRWIAADGHENFPDGEVFTAPLETSAEGEIRFTYPAVFRGRQVDDVRLRFEGGEVVEATAARGQEFLEEMIGVDDGARRIGEFAFGLNDAVTAFTRNILFDEKIGGTVHLALGTAYPECGGTNRSALHWDMICDLRSGSEVYADDQLVYENGRFLNG